MWLFTTYGFFSVVKSRTKAVPGGSGTMLVRARDRQHLENLKTRFKIEEKITQSFRRDYPYRIEIPWVHWVHIAGALASEVECLNFKDEAQKQERHLGGWYIDVLHEVWALMRKESTRKIHDRV